MSVDVRAASPDQWQRVRELRLRALQDSPDAFGSTLERERGNGESEWRAWVSGWEGADNGLFVAVAKEVWVGMAVGSHEHGKDHTHLYGMWVEPDSRRHAVGSLLVEAVLDWSRGRGAAAVELGVTEANPGARAFYRRMGFDETGEVYPLREGSSVTVAVMRRPLLEAERSNP